MADFFIEKAGDQQSLLSRGLIGDVREHCEQAHDARVRFVVSSDDSEEIDESGVGTESDRLTSFLVRDPTQGRDGRRIIPP